MGFKAIPWIVYFKPSLSEFVIRQRHTSVLSERKKYINKAFAQLKPGAAAKALAIQNGAPTHAVIRYRNGTAVLDQAVNIRSFAAALRSVLNGQQWVQNSAKSRALGVSQNLPTNPQSNVPASEYFF